MPQRSAGLLLYRNRAGTWEVLLVHPGGPYWAKRDDGVWSIPKGLYEMGEDPLAAARREFQEETGRPVDGDFVVLGDFKQPSGKIIAAFAVEGTCDAEAIRSNSFEMEWPPRSGKKQTFPEVDRGAWFTLATARVKIAKGQVAILDAFAQTQARRPEGRRVRRKDDDGES